MRSDNRLPGQMRPVQIVTDYLRTAEGSALIEVGHTRVLCAASVEQTVPQFLQILRVDKRSTIIQSGTISKMTTSSLTIFSRLSACSTVRG